MIDPVQIVCTDFDFLMGLQVVHHSELRGVRVLDLRRHCCMRCFDRAKGSSQLRGNRIPHIIRRLCK